jgi:pyridoxine 5-phosphate synthase
MTKLSVNVNKIATLRNARGKNTPDVLQVSLDLIKFGAQGITVHPRPDERHIRKTDVYELKKHLSVEFNIEGYPSDDFLQMVAEVKPAQCTLVPDPPEALTSNAGWRVCENADLLKKATEQLHAQGVRVSVFIDPATITDADFKKLKELHVDRIELYTEAFAEHFGSSLQEKTTHVYKVAAQKAQALGLGVNAGHDLNLINLKTLAHAIPFMDEVSIGHALVADALYLGFPDTIRRYLECLQIS